MRVSRCSKFLHVERADTGFTGVSLEGAWNPPSPLKSLVLTLFSEGLFSVSLREGCLMLLFQPSSHRESSVCTI